jgi:hypothetical protein
VGVPGGGVEVVVMGRPQINRDGMGVGEVEGDRNVPMK